MKEMKKKANNAYAYISIVAIVAIVSLFVMFAGSESKETPQPIVLSGGDVIGDARHLPTISTQNTPTIYVPDEFDQRMINFIEMIEEQIKPVTIPVGSRASEFDLASEIEKQLKQINNPGGPQIRNVFQDGEDVYLIIDTFEGENRWMLWKISWISGKPTPTFGKPTGGSQPIIA